jgi:hypothetical protein
MAADFKVRLSGPGGEVVFEASAPLGEQRTAEYGNYDIIHMPTALLSYRKTSSRTWTISGKLVSRTADEADANARYLDLIRRWLLPDFGVTGATPPILTLHGYRNSNIDGRRVVLKSYGWNFPEEVDYIYSGSQPMPIIGNIEVAIEEVYSAEEITNGAWRLNLGKAGKFIPGEGESSDSFELSLGYGRYDPLATQIPSPNNISSVMSALGGGQPTIPGVIAGTIARTLGTAALNSPAVRAVTGNLPPVLRNILVSGGNVVIGEVGKTVTGTVSGVTQPGAAPGFNRGAPLPATGPVGG